VTVAGKFMLSAAWQMRGAALMCYDCWREPSPLAAVAVNRSPSNRPSTPTSALVLTARKVVRLGDALLWASAVYQSQDRKEGQTRPHAARPRPHRRARLAPSAG
jgi:hypothetical protein